MMTHQFLFLFCKSTFLQVQDHDLFIMFFSRIFSTSAMCSILHPFDLTKISPMKTWADDNLCRIGTDH